VPAPHKSPTTPRAERPKHGLVFLILPSYNELETIADRIQSILAAVGDPIEIIVVDDDSPDGTWSTVEKLNDPRIKVFEGKGRGVWPPQSSAGSLNLRANSSDGWRPT